MASHVYAELTQARGAMDLSIIIVNWHSKEYLGKCIDSIVKSTRNVKAEIIVVDNASFDGCAELLKQHFPQVQFIQSYRNLGFAKANNEAFNLSRGRNLLFLNPDTEVDSAAILTLMRHVESISDTGIAGAKLLNSDRTVQKTAVRVFPTIMNQLLDIDVLMRLFPRSTLWGIHPLFRQSSAPVQVEAISGACMMIKRVVFEKVQMFSTDYFMYSEDIDLCHKVEKLGLKVYYVPNAVVLHHGGASSSANSVKTFSYVMMLESRWRFFVKTRSRWYCCLYRLAMLSASVFRTGIMVSIWPFLILWGRGGGVGATLKKCMALLRWSVGLEKWIKDF